MANRREGPPSMHRSAAPLCYVRLVERISGFMAEPVAPRNLYPKNSIYRPMEEISRISKVSSQVMTAICQQYFAPQHVWLCVGVPIVLKTLLLKDCKRARRLQPRQAQRSLTL